MCEIECGEGVGRDGSEVVKRFAEKEARDWLLLLLADFKQHLVGS